MEGAQARRERLRALKAVAAESAGGEPEVDGALVPPKQQDAPLLKFRNYTPASKKIEHAKVEPAHPLAVQEPLIEPAVEDPDQDALFSVAPKKANWDLQRDIAKKLAKLERRAQRALIQLMQEQEAAKLQGSAEME